METLRELTNDYCALIEYADSTDPADEQVFLDTLEGLVGAIDFKADQYADVMTEISGRIDVLDAEMQRLGKIKKSLEDNKKRMLEALMDAMTVTGRDAIHTDLHTIKIVNNGGVLPLVIDGDVPDHFKKVVLENDNAKIREALNNGATLEFAHLGERGSHLEIK